VIPDFDAIEFELAEIPALDFGTLYRAERTFGAAEGGVVPGDAAKCTLSIVPNSRRSRTKCYAGKNYWCQGDHMFAARGCRARFVCNGGESMYCASINYEQRMCECKPLPKKPKPCRLQIGSLVASSDPDETSYTPYWGDCKGFTGRARTCWGYSHGKRGGRTTGPYKDTRFTLWDAKKKCLELGQSGCQHVTCDGDQQHLADSNSGNDDVSPDPVYDVPADWGTLGFAASAQSAVRTSSVSDAPLHNFPPVQVLFPSLFPDATPPVPPPGPDGQPWTWQRHLRAFVEGNEDGWRNLRSLVSALSPQTSTSGGECSANTKSISDLRGSGFQCQDSSRRARTRALQQAREQFRRKLHND